MNKRKTKMRASIEIIQLKIRRGFLKHKTTPKQPEPSVWHRWWFGVFLSFAPKKIWNCNAAAAEAKHLIQCLRWLTVGIHFGRMNPNSSRVKHDGISLSVEWKKISLPPLGSVPYWRLTKSKEKTQKVFGETRYNGLWERPNRDCNRLWTWWTWPTLWALFRLWTGAITIINLWQNTEGWSHNGFRETGICWAV